MQLIWHELHSANKASFTSSERKGKRKTMLKSCRNLFLRGNWQLEIEVVKFKQVLPGAHTYKIEIERGDAYRKILHRFGKVFLFELVKLSCEINTKLNWCVFEKEGSLTERYKALTCNL